MKIGNKSNRYKFKKISVNYKVRKYLPVSWMMKITYTVANGWLTFAVEASEAFQTSEV
jgi:hypothetical protein